MALPIADRWFERRAIADGVTLLWEPHVIELRRCNIWHVRGRDRDLVIDTATHGHGDHIGGTTSSTT